MPQLWTGVELDGVLTVSASLAAPLGKAIMRNVVRVKRLRHAGTLVKIITPRIATGTTEEIAAATAQIAAWAARHIGGDDALSIVTEPDEYMSTIYTVSPTRLGGEIRIVVVADTGEIVGGE